LRPLIAVAALTLPSTPHQRHTVEW